MLLIFINVSLGLCLFRWADNYDNKLSLGQIANARTLFEALLSIQHQQFVMLRDCLCALVFGALSYWLIKAVANPEGAFFCAWVLCLAVLDLKTKLLPNALTYPLVIYAYCFGPQTFWHAVIASLAIALVVSSISYLYYLWRSTIGFGGGDIKLLMAIAAWFGFVTSLDILLIASFMGLLSFAMLILKQNVIFLKKSCHAKLGLNMKMQEYYAFGPFLAVAVTIQMLI